MTALSKSAKFYRSHPEARKVKAKKDAEINRRPDQVKKRVALNKYNREHGKTGNGDKLDAKHSGNKIVGYQAQSKNRGSKTASKGDRKARG
jgi:hypothetical protein